MMNPALWNFAEILTNSGAYVIIKADGVNRYARAASHASRRKKNNGYSVSKKRRVQT